MPFRIDLHTKGSHTVEKQLEAFSKQLNDGPGEGVMRFLGQAGLEDIRARFRTKGYGTWPPLSEVTIRQKKGRNKEAILVDSGVMRHSPRITHADANTVKVGVPYATADERAGIPAKHQMGEGNVPQRKIVDITPQLLKRLDAMIKRWFKTLIKAS